MKAEQKHEPGAGTSVPSKPMAVCFEDGIRNMPRNAWDFSAPVFFGMFWKLNSLRLLEGWKLS